MRASHPHEPPRPAKRDLQHRYRRCALPRGPYMEAVAFGRKALQQRTQFTSGHRIYVAALAQAGQLEEAREALKQLKELFPAMTIAWIQRYVP